MEYDPFPKPVTVHPSGDLVHHSLSFLPHNHAFLETGLHPRSDPNLRRPETPELEAAVDSQTTSSISIRRQAKSANVSPQIRRYWTEIDHPSKEPSTEISSPTSLPKAYAAPQDIDSSASVPQVDSPAAEPDNDLSVKDWNADEWAEWEQRLRTYESRLEQEVMESRELREITKSMKSSATVHIAVEDTDKDPSWRTLVAI